MESIYFKVRHPKLTGAKDFYRKADEDDKYQHILEAVNYVKVAGANGKFLPTNFYEFGCHSGRTFSATINAAQYLGLRTARHLAFDSFEGLPATDEAEDGIFKGGAYATGVDKFLKIIRSKTGFTIPSSDVVVGFYEHSLTPNLGERMPAAGFVHIDVDLYSSAKLVLDFVMPLCRQGTVILFDDWYTFPGGQIKGERKALEEFLDANVDYAVEPWKTYSTFGRSFFVTNTPQCAA